MQPRTPLLFVGILLSAFLAIVLFSQTPATRAENAVFDLSANERISVGTNNLEANDESYHPYASADGRYIGFISFASNLAPETDGVTKCLQNFICTDVFFRDRVANVTTRLSTSLSGYQGSNTSHPPIVTEDGSKVLFNSLADNLIPDDTNDDDDFFGSDGFLWQSGELVRVTTKANGAQIKGNSYAHITGDGKVIYFLSNGQDIVPGVIVDANELYRRDVASGAITHVPMSYDGTPINGAHIGVQTDRSGRYIVFTSLATNIIPDDINGKEDIYLHDILTGETKLVSHTPTGQVGNDHSAAPSIAPDGSFIAFRSSASDLVPNDNNGASDIFLYNIATEELERVNVSVNGEEANGESKDAATCEGGTFVSFTSEATNLAPNSQNGQRHVYIKHMATGVVDVVSQTHTGELSNGRSYKSYFTPYCDSIMYANEGDNLIPNDTNGVRDLFMRDITLLSDFSTSQQLAEGSADAGDLLTYTVRIHNRGGQTVFYNYDATLPTGVTYVSTTGAVYDSNTNRISASGPAAAGDTFIITIVVEINEEIVEPTLIMLNGQLTGGTQVINFSSPTMVNGLDFYLPIVRH